MPEEKNSSALVVSRVFSKSSFVVSCIKYNFWYTELVRRKGVTFYEMAIFRTKMHNFIIYSEGGVGRGETLVADCTSLFSNLGSLNPFIW